MSHPYDHLSPELILQSVESAGVRPDGRLLELNSYENRVVQLGLDEGGFVIAKFYRPGRWSDAAIGEEHAFGQALAAAEVPVVAPLERRGRTLFEHGGFRFALFPRQGGRCPELDDLDHLAWIGRLLGRIHQVGAARPFRHRPSLDVEGFGREPAAFVLGSPLLPAAHRARYRDLTGRLITEIAARFEATPAEAIRLHGDCHPGNILWTDDGPHFVDLDDCRTGPAIQDLWMLLSGDRREMTLQLDALLEGYGVFRDLDTRELALIEPLRSLRMIHYAAWLARRWDDPAFPRAFPWFGSGDYWEGHLADLEQQLERLAEPPLRLH